MKTQTTFIWVTSLKFRTNLNEGFKLKSQIFQSTPTFHHPKRKMPSLQSKCSHNTTKFKSHMQLQLWCCNQLRRAQKVKGRFDKSRSQRWDTLKSKSTKMNASESKIRSIQLSKMFFLLTIWTSCSQSAFQTFMKLIEA